MKRWIAVIIALALGWGAFWAYEARALRLATESWFEDLRAKGWQADYSGLKVRGFPSRLDMTLTDLTLTGPDGGSWHMPFFQVLGLTYQPGHHILVFPDTQRVATRDAVITIASDGLRASLVHDAQGRVLRSNLEAETLNLSSKGSSTALAGVRLAAEATELAVYRLGLRAEALAGRTTEGSLDGTDIQTIVRFDAPWTLTTLHNPRPQPRHIDLRLARYRVNGLELNMAGSLNISAHGTPDGEITLRAVNWRALLDAARQSGQISDSMADGIEAGLSLLSGLQGKPDTLDIPITYDAGQMRMGRIPLGQAPQIRIP
ncbi:MAG: DUF2125 domain-containing protein [Pelagimonas sp.]|jgi:hypothetical protein|nr:DUF2125 domain-containing protein [Pelagimonas sp.]